jgi:hypothetical protein
MSPENAASGPVISSKIARLSSTASTLRAPAASAVTMSRPPPAPMMQTRAGLTTRCATLVTSKNRCPSCSGRPDSRSTGVPAEPS